MGLGYRADERETRLLRKIFGPEVRSATFYNGKRGRGFLSVEAFDGQDELIDQVQRQSTTWVADHGGISLSLVAPGRDESSTFWLYIP